MAEGTFQTLDTRSQCLKEHTDSLRAAWHGHSSLAQVSGLWAGHEFQSSADTQIIGNQNKHKIQDVEQAPGRDQPANDFLM